MKDFADRFWSKVDRRGADECWTWMAGTSPDGYGRFSAYSRPDRITTNAHRVAWCLAHGVDLRTFSRDIEIRHSCDNPPCCNPTHLAPGSHADNMKDMVQRDRSGHQNRKITEDAVREIRLRASSGEAHQDIARDYPIQRRQVSRIASGERWLRVQ